MIPGEHWQMTDERLRRTRDVLLEIGADWTVLTNADSIAYAIGHSAPIEAGPSPFAAGPLVGIVGARGGAGLLLPDGDAAETQDVVVARYAAYGAGQAGPPYASYRAALSGLVARLHVGGTLATEPESCTALIADILPAGARVPLAPAFRRARAIKTRAEFTALRRCAAVAAAGQRALSGALVAGRTELDIFADLRRAMEAEAGERIAVAGDLLSGPARTAAVGGWPGPRMIRPGDAVLADLGPRVGGYWGDSCATTVLGKASRDQLRLFQAAQAGLDRALEILRPGIAAAELHRQVRSRVRQHGFDYPHHTGHSIGAAVHEHPRLCDAETMTVQAGMVLMVEPGAYHPEIGGARTEWMLRVTAAGCEPMCPFPLLPDTR